MKRLASWFLLAVLVAGLASPVRAEDKAPLPPEDKSPVASIATAVTTITGIAISPLLGTGVYGAYKYFSADTPEKKARLPWFAAPMFWITALGLVGVCALKDTFGAVVPPGLKKPLDVLETIENKISGLVAAGAVVPITMSTLSSVLGGGHASIQVLDTHALAMMPLASVDFSWLLNILTVPFGIAIYLFVWMTSHAINVLILLSPWGAVDAALKGARTAVLGLLTVTAQLDPKIAAIASGVIILISYFTAGWAFRLTLFGTLFCWDFLTGRSGRFRPTANDNWVFSGNTLKGVPVRTYGRLVSEPENGRIVFSYRPWLLLSERTAAVSLTQPHIGRGLFFSTVRDNGGTVLLLPPRYRGHEETLATLYNFEGGVQDAGIVKAWSAMRELFTGSATQVQIR